MAKYLISFDDGWLDFPREDLPAVSDASHAVVAEAETATACRCPREVRGMIDDPES